MSEAGFSGLGNEQNFFSKKRVGRVLLKPKATYRLLPFNSGNPDSDGINVRSRISRIKELTEFFGKEKIGKMLLNPKGTNVRSRILRIRE
ncbi:hypothetical protein RCC89_14645 [Cytophagaceae bacterium ABcell3]|nr:hypothetical protein RCC89_14645 [Cytophagaceae bacterium ABcell3]